MCDVKEDLPALEAALLRAASAHCLLDPGDRVVVAVSGGADSMALLCCLHAQAQALGITLFAAHYEHGIRGEASEADAAFVKALCGRLGVPCHVGHGDVPALAREWRTSVEDAARRARYAYMDELMQALAANKLALAHQLEDQAETVLLHLVHGAGLQGISGMRYRQGSRIRPFLDTPRAQIEAYLRGRGIAWREDATNADTAYARNLLRHEVFPLLQRLNPKTCEAMARTAAQAAQAQEMLDEQAWRALDGNVKRMPYGAFWQVGARANAYAVRRFAEWAGVPVLDARQTEALLAIAPGETMNLPGDWRALRTLKRLHLLRPDPQEAAVSMTAFQTRESVPGELGDGIRTQAFDADALKGAQVRFRRDGDVFAPLGGGTQKLKRTLQDAGIDRPFRDLLPVVAKGERVLWIVGLKPSRDAAVGAHTRRTVLWRYHGDLPWEIGNTIYGGNTDD